MSRKWVALSCMLLFVAGALVSGFYHLRQDEYRDTEMCSASVVVFSNNIRANVTLDFMYVLDKNTGVVAVNGSYYKDDKVIGSIRRDVSYTWTENKDVIYFHSVKVNKVINDDSVSDADVSEILPDFFVYPDKSIAYSLIPQGMNSFMFTVGKRPVFICYR
ncbi:hypothetical protein ACCW94_00010 [Enterobacter soli]|uniref:hypothetical protein n=1 Tax=Enterobacter soli TaxID=885040 RepID=UPI003ED981AC